MDLKQVLSEVETFSKVVTLKELLELINVNIESDLEEKDL